MHNALEDADVLLFEELRLNAALPGPLRQGTRPGGLTPPEVPARVAHGLTENQAVSERRTTVVHTPHILVSLEHPSHCLKQNHATSDMTRRRRVTSPPPPSKGWLRSLPMTAVRALNPPLQCAPAGRHPRKRRQASQRVRRHPGLEMDDTVKSFQPRADICLSPCSFRITPLDDQETKVISETILWQRPSCCEKSLYPQQHI